MKFELNYSLDSQANPIVCHGKVISIYDKKIKAMKKTESEGLIRKARAFALLACLTSLLLLLPAAGSAANAFDYESGTKLIQDTLKYNKSLRTFVTDPSDGIEKKIELRYQNEVLTDVLIDDKRIKKEDYRKYEKIIEESRS